MSSKKHKRAQRTPSAEPRRRKRRINTPSLVFIGILLLFLTIIGIASLVADGPPVDCPPGLVWSDAHNHCH